MVIRWREANRETAEKGEVEERIEMTVRRLKDMLTRDGRSEFKVSPSTTLLLMRKAAE